MNNSSFWTSSHIRRAVASKIHCLPNKAPAPRGASVFKTLAQHGKTQPHVTISRSDMREGLRCMGKCTGDMGLVASLGTRVCCRHIHN